MPFLIIINSRNPAGEAAKRLQAQLQADYGTELYNNLTDNLSDMSRLTTTIQDAIKLGLDIPQDQVQRMYEEVFDQNNLPEGMYDDMIEKFIEDFKIKTGKDLKIGSDGKLTEGNEGKQSESDNDKEEEKYFTTEFSKLSGGLSGFQSGLKQLGIDLNLRYKHLRINVLLDIGVESARELLDILGFHRQTCGIHMTTKVLQEVGARLHRLIEVEACNRASRACHEAIALGEHHRRAIVGLDKA